MSTPRDYLLKMADGRDVEVCHVRNVDRGPKRFWAGARGHAIWLAREAGVVGEVVAVEKLPWDPTRYAQRVAEAVAQQAQRHRAGVAERPRNDFPARGATRVPPEAERSTLSEAL
jgi:hypothetical protein